MCNISANKGFNSVHYSSVAADSNLYHFNFQKIVSTIIVSTCEVLCVPQSINPVEKVSTRGITDMIPVTLYEQNLYPLTFLSIIIITRILTNAKSRKKSIT